MIEGKLGGISGMLTNLGTKILGKEAAERAGELPVSWESAGLRVVFVGCFAANDDGGKKKAEESTDE